eukprot:g8063.t1
MDTAEAREQRELVRTAFVEGSQTQDFEDELEKAEQEKDHPTREEQKKEKHNGELPGWGSWAGEGAPQRRPKAKAKAKAEEPRTEQNWLRRNPVSRDQSPRKPKPSHVSIYEGRAEASKYFVDQVPYGLTPAQMPSGPEWNALPAHLQRIKPKFFSKVGTIVPPLQLVKHLPKESQAGVIDSWAARKQPARLKARI